VTVTVSDDDGHSDTQNYTLNVQGDTQPPQVSLQLSASPAAVGTQEQITVSATDNVGVQSLGLEALHVDVGRRVDL